MAILRVLIIIFLPVFLTGCYEDFSPRVDTKPVLCMNSLITAGEPIEVSLTHTRLFTDTDADITVTDATLSIFANGELKDASYIPREGDRIRLVADSPAYGHAEAEVVVPVCVPIESLSWSADVSDLWRDESAVMSGSLQFSHRVEMRIDDPAESMDYYRMSYLYYYHSGSDDGYWESTGMDDRVTFSLGSLQYESEPLFSEHIGVFESVMGADTTGFTFFTDRQFQGADYTLHLVFPDCRYVVTSPIYDPELLDCGAEFTLHSVSESYYYWANYQWHRDDGFLGDLGNIGLGEPMRGYSNVSSGAGVVAAQSYVSVEISLADFVKGSLGF